MTTDSVYTEMYRIKGMLRQIEIYTDRKRRWNRIASILIVISSFICALASFFSGYQPLRWVTIASAILVAFATLAKDFLHILLQPESEMCELDTIHTFYKGYLISLENIYEQRFDVKSKMDESKLNAEYKKIRQTEGDRDMRVDKLCRKFSNRERKQIKDDTITYFNKYKNKDYEQQTK